MERAGKRFPDAVHSASSANNQSNIASMKTLYCVFCKKDKSLNAFSKTQIAKSVSHIQNPYAPRGYTSNRKHQSCCKQCTPNQQTTLTCMICTKTKPLTDFAKNQRRNAEKARCSGCMKKRDKEEPDEESSTEEEMENFQDEDNEFSENWVEFV